MPDIETIYLYNKILSQIRIRQRIGRVLRQAKDKGECRVIWQKYYPEKKVIPNANIKDCFVPESDKDICREVAEYKKGNQIPPGVYLEKLPKGIEEERELYEYLEFLEILDMFGTEPYTEGGTGVFCYVMGQKRIYFKESEEKGYRQYYQMIMTDYYRELVYLKEEEYRNFAGYAEILGFKDKSNELIEYVKKICFYMSNIKEKDTEGAIAKKRLTVLDRDIMEFYEYVVKNGEMPVIVKTFSDVESGNDSAGSKAAKIVEEYTRKQTFPNEDSLIDAMKARQRILHGEKEEWKKKKYAEILPYGRFGKFQYNEMESARFLMRLGGHLLKKG